MKATEIDIVSLLREYNQNPENKRLKALYSGRTIFEILGKERNETAHSAFLEWLFSGKEISGTSNENTLICLMDSVLKRIAQQKYEWKKDRTLVSISNALLSRTLKIQNIRSKTEKPVTEVITDNKKKEIVKQCKKTKGKKDSVDIYIICDVTGIDNLKRIEFIIENKIGTKEGAAKNASSENEYERLSQTERYYWAFKREKDKENDTYQFFIYLTPSSEDEINKPCKICESEHFTCINYQDIYEDVLLPLLLSEKLGNREEYLIKEYIKVLSVPGIFKSDDNADEGTKQQSINSFIILATSKEEKELLKAYWTNNEKLIIASLQSYEEENYEKNENHDWDRLIDEEGNLYTRTEYIQKVYDSYKSKWEDNDFKDRESIKARLPEFNKKFTIPKSGKYLELSDDLTINILKSDKIDTLRKALTKLNIEHSDCKEQRELEEEIKNVLKDECKECTAEEVFNKKFKSSIKSCHDIIENGIVKSSNSKIKEICDICADDKEFGFEISSYTYDKNEYQSVLTDFWNVNKTLIMASARVLAECNELSETTRNSIKRIYEGISKRESAYYKVSYKNRAEQTLSKLGVIKWYIQTLIWDGIKGPAKFKIANDRIKELSGINKQEIVLKKKGDTGTWHEIHKPIESQGEDTVYYFDISNYTSYFDKVFSYLENNEDGYYIEKIV